MNDLKTGNDLKVWRKNNHLTQKELAGKLSYSVSRLSHIESDNEPLSKKLILQVEKYNDYLHPKKRPNPIILTIKNLKQFNLIYGNEIAMIEKGIVELLTLDTNNGYDNPHEYLKFIASTWSNLSKFRDLDYTDEGMMEARKIINTIQKDAFTYISKKHPKL